MQSINQSINQSIYQSIDQSMNIYIDQQSISQLKRRIHPYALTFKNVLFSAEVRGNWYEYDEESVGGKGFENFGHFLIRNDRSAAKLHITIQRPKTSSNINFIIFIRKQKILQCSWYTYSCFALRFSGDSSRGAFFSSRSTRTLSLSSAFLCDEKNSEKKIT